MKVAEDWGQDAVASSGARSCFGPISAQRHGSAAATTILRLVLGHDRREYFTNPFRTIKAAYAAFCERLSATSDRLVEQDADRRRRLDAYNARNPRGGVQAQDDHARP